MEALEQASGAATGIVRRRRVDQGRLQRILIVESHGEQARDEKARAGHSGRALASASSSGCHSKKPEHPARSLHPSQGGTYFRFPSEIDGTASARYASGTVHRGKLNRRTGTSSSRAWSRDAAIVEKSLAQSTHRSFQRFRANPVFSHLTH